MGPRLPDLVRRDEGCGELRWNIDCTHPLLSNPTNGERVRMATIFDISKQYSQALDELRGPSRKRNRLGLARAWELQSSSRRAAFRVLSAGLVLGIAGLVVAGQRKSIARAGSKLRDRAGRIGAEAPAEKAAG